MSQTCLLSHRPPAGCSPIRRGAPPGYSLRFLVPSHRYTVHLCIGADLAGLAASCSRYRYCAYNLSTYGNYRAGQAPAYPRYANFGPRKCAAWWLVGREERTACSRAQNSHTEGGSENLLIVEVSPVTSGGNLKTPGLGRRWRAFEPYFLFNGLASALGPSQQRRGPEQMSAAKFAVRPRALSARD